MLHQCPIGLLKHFLIQNFNGKESIQSDNVRTMRKMDNLHLVEFAELRLKSMNDFEPAYDIVLSTGLAKYMQKFVLLQPRHWPCKFYCRQFIYHCVGKFHRSSSQRTNSLQETLFTSNDHSFYSYPTGNMSAI